MVSQPCCRMRHSLRHSFASSRSFARFFSRSGSGVPGCVKRLRRAQRLHFSGVAKTVTRDLLREVAKAMELHGAPVDLVRGVREIDLDEIDFAFTGRVYDGLEAAGASRFVLGTIGSWRDGNTDQETLEMLRDLNAGTFEFQPIASTGGTTHVNEPQALLADIKALLASPGK